MLGGFGSVGVVRAWILFGRFGALKGVFVAAVEELGVVLGKRAGEFRGLLDYKS